MSSRAYPPALRELEIWCPWSFDSAGRKRPRAPHLTDHCYPVSWGKDADRRPETDFETCMKYVELRTYEFSALGLAFPDDDPDQRLEAGILLPHDPPRDPAERVVQIDFDDVRDPATGEIHPTARELIASADSYAALSSSGEGVHLLVFGRLPAPLGKFIGQLDDDGEPFRSLTSPPQVEIYDHGRVAALTGEHLEGTPLAMRERVDLIDAIVDEFGDGELDVDQEGEQEQDQALEAARRSFGSSGSGSTSTSRSKSDYFAEHLVDFAPADHSGAAQTPTHGAHPTHGGTSSDDRSSMNYHIDESNVWHCFAHDSGGGPLHMAAIMARTLECRDAGKGALEELDDDDFLDTCLYARDRLGFSGKPPYRAIVAVARAHGLAFANPDDDVLGRSAYSVARQIYDNSSY